MMKAIVLKSESKADLKFLMKLAEKIGVTSKVLSKVEMEELGLLNAIRTGRTNAFTDTAAYISKLKQ